MKKIMLLAVSCAALGGVLGLSILEPSHATARAVSYPQAMQPEQLIGEWKVDLRSKPGDAPYYQTMVIESIDGNKIKGKFYNSEIRDGHINVDWGALHFAFVTSDGKAPYNTAGRLVNGRLEGTTNSLGRGFLAVWTAERMSGGR